MARRKFTAKKKTYRRRRAAGSSGGLASTVLRALKGYALLALKRKLGLNTETKYIDVVGSTTATATLGSRISSPTIPQGLTVSQRQGVNIRVTKVEQRINILAAAAATNGCNVRILTVRAKLQDGVPVVADILQTPTDFSSPIHNLFKEHGLELLQDEIVRVGTPTADNASVTIERTFSLPNGQMTWIDSDTTGVPANLVRGAIVTYWYLDNVTTAPYFTATNRFWYVDN